MHALRLGVQGVELLTTGRITLPVPEPERAYLRQVRRGEVRLDDVVAQVDEAEARLAALRDTSDLPAEPDRAWVDAWLHRSHLAVLEQLTGTRQSVLFCRGQGDSMRVGSRAV
jgi:hypothetical protein